MALNDKVREVVNPYLDQLNKTTNNISRSVKAKLGQFDTRDDGVVVRSPLNDEIIADIISAYDRAIGTGVYDSAFNKMVGAGIDKIFDEALKEFTGRAEITPKAMKSAETARMIVRKLMQDKLSASGLRGAILTPAINEIYKGISRDQKSDLIRNIDFMLATASQRLAEKEAATFLFSYARELTQIFAGGQDLLFEYSGPEDSKNRGFCSERVGDVFTSSEIADWSNESWDGKIPGTNQVTIFTNLGGYNCRHTLTPV